MNPTDVFAPGIAGKLASYTVDGDPAMGWVEVDPPRIRAPGKAR